MKPLISLTKSDIAKILSNIDDGWRSEKVFAHEIRVILKCSDEASREAFNQIIDAFEFDPESNPFLWRIKR